jgi:uncharacterized integral membrane protein
MWIIRTLFIVIILILLLGFAVQNAYQRVSINILSKQYANVPMIVVLFLAFVIGILVWLIFTIFQYFKMQADIYQERKRSRRLTEEIKALRNRPLQEVEENPD